MENDPTGYGVLRELLGEPAIEDFAVFPCYNMDMVMRRNTAKLTKSPARDNGFINATPAQRISYIWDLTAEVWGMNGSRDAERRLQRHIASLIRE